MLFWIIASALAATVAISMIAPLRRPAPPSPPDADLAFYRSQLAEIEHDRARGLIGAEEADRARAEIGRRLIQADRAGQRRAAAVAGPRRLLGLVAGVGVVAGALALYAQLGAPGAGDLPLSQRIADAEAARAARPSQSEAERRAGTGPEISAPEDYVEMVAQLREAVPQRPDDLTGWQLLSRHEAALGNFAAAARAQERVIALKGDEAGFDDRLALVDRMVAATGGLVTAESETLLRALLETRPDAPAALYYMGLLQAQTDRPDLAFRYWRQVVEQGDPEAPHVRMARAQVGRAAALAGVDYAPPSLSGPSADDIAAAQDMSPEAQAGMIRGMVDGLAQRLASEGGSAQDWARLIDALAVLGEATRAEAIWSEAQQVFAGTPDLETIRAAARKAGVAE
ncbi:c-type cytochrome biogenesis protein CcmI [Limimaricola pyoseonensis]|uniref:Cytochrome c-type biogenesis protein CcmH n=1 Tax=Limimaricola pyoseonensis TaxID=521013 RepID=A0A1G6ZQT8_9RHOB|nr:c-type cytochrome biogenesis protein CcmI [Limimaricola pyoseonensis]SDE04743.1 cytochrome c-type biogenesis protein CcmH [Limimaricola pyoseonensis]